MAAEIQLLTSTTRRAGLIALDFGGGARIARVSNFTDLDFVWSRLVTMMWLLLLLLLRRLRSLSVHFDSEFADVEQRNCM